MIVYGIEDCIHCRQAKAALESSGVSFEFRALGERVQWLKEFLALRDSLSLYDEAKTGGYIGIPTFVFSNGVITLDLDQALAAVEQNKHAGQPT